MLRGPISCVAEGHSRWRNLAFVYSPALDIGKASSVAIGVSY